MSTHDLIVEQATVESIEADGAWVSTFQQSACSSCQMRAGCGQRLLAKGLNEQLLVKALATQEQLSKLTPGQSIKIGIARDIIAAKSLQLYLLPLVSLVLGAVVGDALFGYELATIAFAALGLVVSAVYLRRVSFKQRCDERVHPVILE